MLAEPTFARKIIDQGQDPQSSSPAELTAYMRAESDRWSRVVTAAGLGITQ